MVKIIGIVGARPNFIKIDPIFRQLDSDRYGFDAQLVHTGQHYDVNMSRVFFKELGLRKPDYDLGVGSGTHAVQTAQVMMNLEPILIQTNPDLVLVVGDVNSTLAAALTAAKLNVPVAHVEAGLRSFDRRMPEEVNRIVTDSISTLLFTTSKMAGVNLVNEGVDPEKIFFVGNVMIDTLMRCRKIAEQSKIFRTLAIERKRYILVTLHRPSNVDAKEKLSEIVDALLTIAHQHTVVFPLHPRTQAKLRQNKYEESLQKIDKILLTPSLGYLDFLALEANASLVLTDSGGVQEETTVLGVPCITIRENTERPVTIEHGTNHLIACDSKSIEGAVAEKLGSIGKHGRIPELWDGRAAVRIAEVLKSKLGDFKNEDPIK